MLKAQLHSKFFHVDEGWREDEDILTGDFFGIPAALHEHRERVERRAGGDIERLAVGAPACVGFDIPGARS
jgi:hypothetical protein